MFTKRLGIDLGTPAIRLPQSGGFQPRTPEGRDCGVGRKYQVMEVYVH
jgi:hypothetical protein